MAAAVICLSGGARKRIWSLAVTLDELTDYFALLDNGSGVVAEVGVLWNSTLDYFYIDADDLELDSLLPAGRYSLRVFKTADGVYSSSGSGEAALTIGRLVFLHYGLGGPVLGTGADGEVIWSKGYRPFGGDLEIPEVEINQGENLVKLGFVGKQYDDDVGLYQLGARWYDPELGRFVSVDPVRGFLNDYAYAYNNPFRYQDANGLAVLPIGFTPATEWTKPRFFPETNATLREANDYSLDEMVESVQDGDYGDATLHFISACTFGACEEAVPDSIIDVTIGVGGIAAGVGPTSASLKMIYKKAGKRLSKKAAKLVTEKAIEQSAKNIIKKGGRRGSQKTCDHIDQVRDEFLDANPDYKHVGGGRDRLTGAEIPEEYLPGPSGGKKGSSYSDLTFEGPDGSRNKIQYN